ncbi:MAG: hypothetical protein M1838_001204 [Thelocarpon superellum]|nr:MAG: hypothetical protein M1838_001204 [Thelocarpon superellum]
MGFKVSSLWREPEINPVNQKAKTIPFFNPFNIYGRVFLLSWWGFFVAFWSWYAFPPLLTVTIKQDLKLSQVDIANSNILSLTATLIVRLSAGTACDTFGPRWTFVFLLLAGAIPTALAGTVTNASGLIAVRFFVGILGGTFIPCQVWTTGFFDKSTVGAANSLAAGLGNAGGGITYFLMPAIFDSLVSRQGMTPHTAWRVTFVVPFILIVATALAMILSCPDTPTGRWSSRRLAVEQRLATRDTFLSTVAHPKGSSTGHDSLNTSDDKVEIHPVRGRHGAGAADAEQDLLEAASWELVEKPTYHGSTKAVVSLPTLTLIVVYFCSFGAELSINSVLGAYYLQNFPYLGQTGSGNWAAMFGILNAVCRPAGGIISDFIYRKTRSLWGKKILVHLFAFLQGTFLIIIGFMNPTSEATMFGLMAGLAFFIEAGNGACFSLVPHVHPTSNGLITGVTGASGNLGGIVFLLVSRYNGTAYGKLFWIIGIVTIAANLAVSFLRPIPRNQLGGR